MNSTVPRLLKTHSGDTNNSTDYTPAFVSQSPDTANPANLTGVGYFTPTWFGIHNPETAFQTVTVWTIDQGTDGVGVTVRINAGETFYSTIAKLTVAAGHSVTLIGVNTTQSR